MADFTALYREDATEAEQIDIYQHLIDTGEAWRLEGHVGRTAMNLIEDGYCVLGETGHTDYWGSHVPSRHEIEPGSLGSIEYARERQPERWPEEAAALVRGTQKCLMCHGEGKRLVEGSWSATETCPRCDGTGLDPVPGSYEKGGMIYPPERTDSQPEENEAHS